MLNVDTTQSTIKSASTPKTPIISPAGIGGGGVPTYTDHRSQVMDLNRPIASLSEEDSAHCKSVNIVPRCVSEQACRECGTKSCHALLDTVQFTTSINSVQSKRSLRHLGKLIQIPNRLSEVSRLFPLKQCWSDWRYGPFSFCQVTPRAQPICTPLSSRWMAWSPWLGGYRWCLTLHGHRSAVVEERYISPCT